MLTSAPDLSNLPGYILIVLFLGLWLFCAIKFVLGRIGPERKVRAKIIDKFTREVFDKYNGTGKHTRYIIVFSVGGKKRSFYVSELTYHGYSKGESGTLTYRGSRLIDFH